MKTKLLYLLFFISIYSANADLRQTGYRWRNDDGNETTATWKANANTPVTIANESNSTIRLRVQLYNFNGEGGNDINVPKSISYTTDSDNTSMNLHSDNSHFKYVDSSNVTAGEATTEQIGTGSFQSGEIGDKQINGITTFFSLSTSKYTEVEYVITPTVNATNNTYYFKNGNLNGAGNTLAVLTLVDPITLNNNTLEPGSFSYNNPINNTLNIESKNKITNVVIHNISGQKILEGNSTTLNTESLNSGLYFVTISTKNNKKATFKIVKE